MSTVSLAVVGTSLVAWQVYTRATATTINKEAETKSQAAFKRKVNYVYSNEPEFIQIYQIPKDTPFMLDPSSECMKAKGELRSLLKRKQWKLLKAANSEESDLRTHFYAVKELSLLAAELSDGDFRQLAQAAAMRTAVGLAARTPSPDPRFFMPPPPLPIDVETSKIPTLFRAVLTSLPSDDKAVPECIRQFTDTALRTYVEMGDDDTVADYDLDNEFFRAGRGDVYSIPRQAYFTGTAGSANDSAFLEYCLGVLLSHSTLESHCEKMVATPLFPLLIRIVRENPHNARLQSLVGKILANMAMFPSTHDAIWRSGFVGILGRWKGSPNLLVTLPAAKALQNLDRSYSTVKYGPGVYPILDRRASVDCDDRQQVDVVFLHGLLGGLFYTWRQIDHDNSRGWGTADLVSSSDYSYCWPKDWFKEDKMDERGVRVIGVDFDTYLSQWGGSCPKESFKTSLKERGQDIYQKLRDCGVGDRKVVFVGHSMGGLIIKQMLVEAQSRNDNSFVENTRGVVFYSTPHNGSNVAKLNKTTKLLFFPTTEVQDLEPDSPALGSLHHNFVDLVRSLKVKVISFGEAVKTPYLGMDIALVSGESANPGCGEHFTISENHMNICKPKGKGSILYRKLANLIWDELDEIETEEP